MRYPRRRRHGRPAAPAAVLASISLRAASGIAARIGVSMMPGETQLTRTGASSSASARDSDSSAPLATLTMAEFGRGRMLRKPETSVSDPPLRNSAARATRQAPQNLPSMVARTSSIATVLNGPVRSCAAVTTTWSTGPRALEQIGDALVVGDVGRDRDRVQPLRDRVEPGGIARGDDDIGAFALGQFRGGEANAGRTADDHDFLACKLHAVSLEICHHAG